jgi:hypothetical protein
MEVRAFEFKSEWNRRTSLMQMAIKREGGVRVDAMLLAASANRMRVVVSGSTDTEEWAKHYGVWRTEDGKQIEIEAMFVDGNDSSEFFADLCPRMAVMGASYS